MKYFVNMLLLCKEFNKTTNMITAEQLKNYYPFNKMDERFLPLLVKQFKVKVFVKGDNIFIDDDNKIDAKYIIDGAVNITYPSGREKLLKSTSLQSYYPVGEVNTRKKLKSEVTSKTASVIMLNNIFIDHFTVWDNLFKETPKDSPLRGHDSYQWVVGLLFSKAVQMLPRGHVDQIFKNLEPVYVNCGDEIITEGDAGDYCYVIVKGEAGVYKCIAEGEEQVAKLETGALFGENALVSNEPRTASVRMLSNGILMKMRGEKFSSLLKSHVVRWLTADATYEMMLEDAVLVDVREQDEFDNMSFADSIHIPLGELRDECTNKLDIKRPVITCSSTGLRCASAAFLLATLGYDVYSMQGGVMGLLKLVERQQED
ncbi:MAG TPA: cyclic nucleotide-binding domain-containing protein [Oceanospirillales bacterium]|nr:cyclic nucleotide-binding domain-containing protein [Oceanospirillales bacterium]